MVVVALIAAVSWVAADRRDYCQRGSRICWVS